MLTREEVQVIVDCCKSYPRGLTSAYGYMRGKFLSRAYIAKHPALAIYGNPEVRVAALRGHADNPEEYDNACEQISKEYEWFTDREYIGDMVNDPKRVGRAFAEYLVEMEDDPFA